MKHQVNIAVQIVPVSKQDTYPIIDKAIEVIEKSGLKYMVGPMETVIQGDYDTIMKVVKDAQQACLDAGAEGIAVTLKVHARAGKDVNWDEKGLERRRV